MVKYLWNDKSGRGESCTIDSDQALIDFFDPFEDTNWDGETIEEWLDNLPAVGDIWENESDKVTKIE